MGPKTIALITYQRHLEVRKMLLPAFAPKTMLQYIPRITEIAEEFCESWAASQQLKGEQAMKAYTGKVCCVALKLTFAERHVDLHTLPSVGKCIALRSMLIVNAYSGAPAAADALCSVSFQAIHA